jgi:hypothetical protein
MELSPSFWEAASRWVTQEFSQILWNPNVYYRVHKSPTLLPILNRMNPAYVYTTPLYLSKSHFNIILPPACCLFLLVFPPKSYLDSTPLHAF